MNVAFAPQTRLGISPQGMTAASPAFGKRQLVEREGKLYVLQGPVDTVDKQCAEPEQAPEKFSLWRAGKNFLKGLFSPITKIVQHPVKALLGIGAGVVLATLCPVTVPLMFIGGALFGGYKILKGVHNAISNYSQGHMRAAEEAFYDIGEGTAGLGLTAIGARKAAIAAAEAKAAVTGADVAAAGKAASELGFFGRVKEAFSMFSREGIHAVWKNLLDPFKHWAVGNKGQLAPFIKAVIGLIPGLNSIPGLGQVVDPAFNVLGTIPDCPMMNACLPRNALGQACPDTFRKPANRMVFPNGQGGWFIPTGVPGYHYSMN